MANAALLATVGDQTASQAAGSISALMPPGVILPYGGSTPPNGWLLCDGSAISRITYANLFQAIGTAHGQGDGSVTFNLPDFRGRFMRGVDGSANRDPDKAGRTAANTGGNTGNNVGSVQSNATAKNGLTNSSVITTSSGNRNQFDRTSGTVSSDHAHYTTVGDNGSHGHSYNINIQHGDGAITGGESLTSGLQLGGRRRYIDSTDGVGNHGHGGWSGGHNNNHTHTTAWDGTFSVSGTAAAQTISGDNETRPLNINVNYIIKI